MYFLIRSIFICFFVSVKKNKGSILRDILKVEWMGFGDEL